MQLRSTLRSFEYIFSELFLMFYKYAQQILIICFAEFVFCCFVFFFSFATDLKSNLQVSLGSINPLLFSHIPNELDHAASAGWGSVHG